MSALHHDIELAAAGQTYPPGNANRNADLRRKLPSQPRRRVRMRAIQPVSSRPVPIRTVLVVSAGVPTIVAAKVAPESVSNIVIAPSRCLTNP